MFRNIFAFTEGDKPAPAYCSFNTSHGITRVTVRSTGIDGKTGPQAECHLTEREMSVLSAALRNEVAPLQQDQTERWMSRALKAEHDLFRAGLRSHTPADIYSDDAWLCATLTHKDGSTVHIAQLTAARARTGG